MSSGPRRFQIFVCRGPECGGRRRADDVAEAFAARLREDPAPGGAEVHLDRWSCFGRCRSGVNVMVRPLAPGADARRPLLLMPMAGAGGALYHAVTPPDVPRILDSHIARGEVARELTNPDRAPTPAAPRTPPGPPGSPGSPDGPKDDPK